MKRCSRCEEEKPLDEFWSCRANAKRDGKSYYCKSCGRLNRHEWTQRNKEQINAKHRELYAANPEYYKRKANEWYHRSSNKLKARLYKHGLTEEVYHSMVEVQQGLCLICKIKPELLVVDHDHETGKVRGLLCSPCNIGLGFLKDSIPSLKSAITYLKNNKK